jgi:hypothetical protein
LVKVWKAYIDATPLQVANLLDLGYMGVQNDFPLYSMYVLPFRKNRKKSELSNEEKSTIENIPN